MTLEMKKFNMREITFKPDELYIKKFKKRKRMRKYKSNIYLNK